MIDLNKITVAELIAKKNAVFEYVHGNQNHCNPEVSCKACPVYIEGDCHDFMVNIADVEAVKAIMSYEIEPQDPHWPVDTKVLVRNRESEDFEKRYYSHFENGRYFCFNYGKTSWSSENKAYWKYAKLAEEETK